MNRITVFAGEIVETDEVLRRLDRIVVLLELAFKEQIESARMAIRADPVAAAILDLTAENWVSAGSLKQKVAKSTGQSERTVKRRVSALVDQAFLEAEGSGPSVRYRSAGIA